MPETLEFEEPIAALLKEIEALTLLPHTDAREREIEVAAPAASSRSAADLYASLTPWQRVLVARHPNRPGLEDFIQRLFTGLRRDPRRPALRRRPRDHDRLRRLQRAAGAARRPRQGRRHQGKDLPQLRLRAARRATARRCARCGWPRNSAGRSSSSSTRRRRIPGIESEERGVAEAIAVNLRDMMLLDTPIIVIVSGEGGSGGALGIAVGDRVLMQEFAIYSVIPPEGCAAILWRDPAKKVEAAAGAEADRARSAEGRHHRRDHPRADRRRAHRSGRGGADSSTARCERVLARGQRARQRQRASRGATTSSGTWAGSGIDFIDAVPDACAVDADRRSALGRHMPCDDGAAADAGGGARRSPPSSRGCCASAAWATRNGATRFLNPSPRSPARSDGARRHGRRGRSHPAARSRARSGSRSTATTTSTASRRP